MIGYEIYNQKPGISSINKHFQRDGLTNNYILTKKYSSLLTFGYVRRLTQFYDYSINDVSSIISNYVSNNSFDFNIGAFSDRFEQRASIVLDIYGIDLSTNEKTGFENIKPITFSLKHIQRPKRNCICKRKYTYGIRMGLTGYEMKLSNKDIQRGRRLTKQDFLREYSIAAPSFRTFEQSVKGLSRTNCTDDYEAIVLSDKNLLSEESMIKLIVDLAKKEVIFHGINENDIICVKKMGLKDDMNYVFTLEVRDCRCPKSADEKNCICRLKVEQS